MPNTPTHDFLTIASAVVLAPGLYGFFRGIEVTDASALVVAAVIGVAHLVSGVLFSPDLDVDSRIHKRWGILFFVWQPYKWVIPHRHFWSHGLVLPPLLRLLYFYWCMIGLLFAVEYLLQRTGMPIPTYSQTVAQRIMEWVVDHPVISLSIAFGFVTGAAVHSIADWVVSGGKQLLRTLFVPPSRRSVARKSVYTLVVPTRWLFDPFTTRRPRHF